MDKNNIPRPEPSIPPRARHSDGTIDTLHTAAGVLMSEALNQTVSDHIMAGPHGALLPPQSAISSPDRWSFVSTHTLLTRHPIGSIVDEPVDFETAIGETGHGCFQYKLMALCGYIYACCSLSTTTLSFVLPVAQFNGVEMLDSVQKGLLNTAPLCGMIAGAYIWGNFADNKGRRFVLLWTLSIDSISAYLSSLSQHFEMFYCFRIFNGFAIIGATSIIFAYMGEFLNRRYRDKYLTILELFWTLGIIFLPVIGVSILPFEKYLSFGSKGSFFYNAWRIFVFTCGIPTTIGAILVYRMPESPRFLIMQGKLEKTRQVLERMYVSNTGKPKTQFSVKVLSESPGTNTYYSHNDKNLSFCGRFKKLMKGIYRQHRELFSGKSLFNIILTCYIDFGLISVYYTMMLWVPELLNRMDMYHVEQHEKNLTATDTLCQVMADFADKGDSKLKLEIEMSTYLHTIITCLACLPTTLILLCLINWVSKKALLVGIMVSAAIPAIWLSYVWSEFQMVTMLSLLKSLTNLAEAILFVAIVEIFPVNTRGTALSLTVTVGRIGSVVGNVIFGVMIDRYCRALFYLMGANLVLSGLACLLLPKMQRGHGHD